MDETGGVCNVLEENGCARRIVECGAPITEAGEIRVDDAAVEWTWSDRRIWSS